MIGFLRGKVAHKQPPALLLDVNGVGYELQAPMSTFYALPEGEQTVALYTHMAIRDDAHILYAFTTLTERALFCDLLKVNGVGGKMALAILSGMTTDEFIHTIQAADSVALTRLPGIGKKTAERLIIEMRDRLPSGDGGGGVKLAATTRSTVSQSSVLDDALGALLALGYKSAEAQRMLKSVEHDNLSAEEVIRQALKTVS